ncbi:adenosine deaminase [Streptococcus gallolyticus]|uniref:Adenosine deaminase n=1 Tax=Streptococcus gallolyticus TaxID=315405 RepID=A0AA94M3X4_9STRE|nr:adenosine deaminase [Streptococcus gallolyticus]AQP42636.1 adenosine deaminase [Streptococcus gallolyticus subsp. gallolyticus DSM 16831]MCY7184250.1 adenosine deaminase [Streptococcus gallolyticus subsp. gallolyticus]MCY7190479.1 adenosine deaminase [Streptococcus gallolyticus subsp. gallolyticus]MDO4205210.1 adenosine deaminase [Streptococcus gallolyticus]WAW98347.1 adenosine deaminase [Streptococcus gallolyticus]
MDKTTLKDLAKAELHCHLDGSISLEVIRQLAEMANIVVPVSDKELKQLVVAPENAESLMDYLKTFDFVRPLLQTKEALHLAAYDVARQAAQENVIYTEIRFAPELSMDEGLSASETVEAVLAGLKQAEEEFGIVAKVLVCGMKQSPKEVTRDIFEHVVELAEKGLVGFDFAGNELDFPPAQLADLIKETQALGLPMTFHAGECGCAHYIADSIALDIKRIGHSTAIYNQPELIQEFIEKGVTAELCLTSNLQTKAAKSLDEFPFLALKNAGAKITINTDNRTVSDTNLTKEYALFVKHFGVSVADFLAFNKNAIQASFTNEAQKAELLSKIDNLYETFL